MAQNSSHSVDTSFIRRWAETRGFRAGLPVAPRFTPDGKEILFLRSPPKSFVQSLWIYDVATGKSRPLLTPEQLLGGAEAHLSVAEKARLERQRISARGITHYHLDRAGQKVLVGLAGKLWVMKLHGGQPRALPIHSAIDPRFSPDGKEVSWVEDGDLRVLDLRTGKTRRLTWGATETLTHGLAEFVAQEEMDRYTGYWWSPDSKYLAYEEADTSKEELFHIADALHPEQAPASFRYPRAGKANAKVRLGILPARSSGSAPKTVWVKWNADRYPYLARVTWADDAPLTILVQNRAQTEEQLLAVDPRTGKTTRLLTERDPAWIDLKLPFPVWRDDGSGFFWYTERHGGPEVEFRNARGKKVATWVKPGDHFMSWVGFDEATGWLYFTADPTPPTRVLYRVKPGHAPERVGAGDEPSMTFSELSRSGDRLLEIHESLTQMPSYRIVSTDGARLGTLPSSAPKPPFRPNVQILKVGSGEGYWTEVIRPRNFERGKKLPVIVYVYGGPTVTVVNAAMSDDLLLQWVADQGFLVVKIDNRGTPGRGRAWSRAIKGNFAGATLDDQISGLRALAKEVPEMDLHRVGITGSSFGGYMSALAVLKRPDVYRAAVAISPVVDWHDYDTHYTERYLGLPETHPEAYRKSSLLTYVPGKDGALLLVHGTADDNVYFFNSLKLADALFRAGKSFDFIPLAGFTHMVTARDPRVAERLYERMVSFFHQHLR